MTSSIDPDVVAAAWDTALAAARRSGVEVRSLHDMESLNLPHPSVNVTPGFYGVHLDNDPSKRLVAIVNHNSDIAEYWEWSGTGMLPVDTTNDAYKLGVNYMIYGLTR